MAMQQGEDLAVSTSARQRWRLPGLAAIMTAGSAALIITRTDGGLDVVVGLLGLAFFGPITLWSLLRAITPQPALILSAGGFTDRATATGAGFVPWPEVQRIDARLFLGRVLVTVTVKDPAAFRRRQPAGRRLLLRINRSLVAGDVFIPENLLPMPAADLVHTMRALHHQADGLA